ncbi:HPP family protein [Yinghuangia seranimata]|uniref:HPP family protein n=1 Tax=Yinghuangia seranimata TaxID=408067 RepID=UPI00248C50EC|nr:HPP family protein [Yinghuangia seranimata]MDI2128492.1 HPP family protein [Yinghuangia seranimata]
MRTGLWRVRPRAKWIFGPTFDHVDVVDSSIPIPIPPKEVPMSGSTAPPSKRPAVTVVLASTGATVAALLLLAAVSSATHLHLFALPFAASAAIVAFAPHVPFAQPRAIVGGHVSASLVALLVTWIAGPSVWTAAVAAGLATAPMLLLRAPHPPATATAALIGLSHPHVSYLLNPVLPAALLVIAGGFVLGRILPDHRYPSSWW